MKPISRIQPPSDTVLMCHRCEWRARYRETGHGPRCECMDTEQSVSSCYMYQPVLPVVHARAKGDRRPLGAGWMLAPRLVAKRVARAGRDVVGAMFRVRGGYLRTWEGADREGW